MLYECTMYCNAEGTDKAEEMGVDRPDPVKRPGAFLMQDVMAVNESRITGQEGTIVYLRDGDSINIATAYPEFIALFKRYHAASQKAWYLNPPSDQ